MISVSFTVYQLVICGNYLDHNDFLILEIMIEYYKQAPQTE